MNLYNILEIEPNASETEIKKAYLENAILFHPDTHPENNDMESFSRINKAYYTLLDYIAAARQESKYELISLARERVLENLILVKIKD